MSDNATTPQDRTNHWAKPVDRLAGPEGQGSAVDGRRLSGPVQGFGKLWQKTYRVDLPGVDMTPAEVSAEWRANYGSFWPKGNRFTAPLAGIQPGEIGLISGKAGGLTLSTGIMVVFADEESFCFMTPEGHPFAGLITFSVDHAGGQLAAQVQLLIRAHDPMVEVGMAFGGHRKEDHIWIHTLTALAQHFGVADPAVDKKVVCVDKKRQWKRFGNIRHDAVFYALRHPFRKG